MKKLSRNLSGAAGEYYAAAELSKRGFLAATTNFNSEYIDILAAAPNAGKTIKIQVKTTQGKSPKWKLDKKNEAWGDSSSFYIFVRLNEIGSLPDFYIVPSKIVAENIKVLHKKWLSEKKKNGGDRKDTSIRAFRDEIGTYKDSWKLLENRG